MARNFRANLPRVSTSTGYHGPGWLADWRGDLVLVVSTVAGVRRRSFHRQATGHVDRARTGTGIGGDSGGGTLGLSLYGSDRGHARHTRAGCHVGHGNLP